MNINIISTCTSTKRHESSPETSMQKWHNVNWENALEEWLEALQKESNSRYKVTDLYQGGHWTETKACIEQAKIVGFNPKLWILSAGWGFISGDQMVAPYASTFSSVGDDSIHRLSWPSEYGIKEKSRAWWDSLNRGLTGKNIKERLTEYQKEIADDSSSLNLFILSREYYNAIEHEILELIGAGHQVLVISSSLYNKINVTHPAVRSAILPFSDKFKQADEYLNKNNISLNARLGTWIFKDYSQELRKGASDVYQAMIDVEISLPEMVRKPPNPISEEEALEFISRTYDSRDGSAAQSLRVLRDVEKKSYEQKRFGNLFGTYEETNKLTEEEVLAFISRNYDSRNSTEKILFDRLHAEQNKPCKRPYFRSLLNQYEETNKLTEVEVFAFISRNYDSRNSTEKILFDRLHTEKNRPCKQSYFRSLFSQFKKKDQQQGELFDDG
jgi:hypothetical protein